MSHLIYNLTNIPMRHISFKNMKLVLWERWLWIKKKTYIPNTKQECRWRDIRVPFCRRVAICQTQGRLCCRSRTPSRERRGLGRMNRTIRRWGERREGTGRAVRMMHRLTNCCWIWHQAVCREQTSLVLEETRRAVCQCLNVCKLLLWWIFVELTILKQV